jgi:hypothetical protein
VLTKEQAEQRAGRIRSSVASWVSDLSAAWTERDWAVLGYPDWAAYLQGEFGGQLQFSAEDRRLAVQLLSAQGMSQVGIAQATGADRHTVQRDQNALQGAQNAHPADSDQPAPRVTGADGRSYPAHRPDPAPAAPLPPPPAAPVPEAPFTLPPPRPLDEVDRRMESSRAIENLIAACDTYAKMVNGLLLYAGELPEAQRPWLQATVDRVVAATALLARYVDLGRSEIDSELAALFAQEGDPNG